MLTAAFLFCFVSRFQDAATPSIQYYQGNFEVHSSGRAQTVPLALPATHAQKYVAFRRNNVFAVWDERGMTLRHGADVYTTRLSDIPVSPRIFAHDEIVRTLQRIHAGRCSRDAAALAGARRLGKDAYFLVRWVDADGNPWLEALFDIDLTADRPRPRLLGRFEGLSTATGAIDDKLLLLGGKPAIVEREANTWGLATYDPETREFRNQPLGASLQWLQFADANQAFFIETSSYGTTIAGRVNFLTSTRKILYEGREQVRFLDTLSPEIVLASSPGKTKLVNCGTGSIRVIPYQVDGRRAAENVVLWTPPDEPAGAWLMNPDTWHALAIWKPGNPATPAEKSRTAP